MTRRDLVGPAGGPIAATLAAPASPAGAAGPLTSAIELANRQFRLRLTPGDGLQCHLLHVPSGSVLADGAYGYSFGNPTFDELRNDAGSAVLRGKTETGLVVEHRFTVNPDSDWIEEQITLTNPGPAPINLYAARCGFLLPIPLSSGKPDPKLAQQQFTAVPFVREPNGSVGQYAEYSLAQLLTEPFRTALWARPLTADPTSLTPAYAAEGWIWHHGEQRFLITKYSQSGMEWAILDRVQLPQQALALCWGGMGIYRDNPQQGAWLAPGGSHRFGTLRVTPVKGDRNQAFYAFRAEMAARGHDCPAEFNPPVHWNEIYDNKLWWLPDGQQDDPEMRKKYYTLADLRAEAAKAQDYSCESLYLDPGWDTRFASKIWDEARLGSFKSFTTMLASEYGLKCSLHTPVSGWCDPASYPVETRRLDRFGQRATARWTGVLKHCDSPLCGASDQYLDETARRLESLARDGAAYFMFDGSQYQGECWDEHHGHAVPARAEEHVEATMRLARMVHEKYPDVLIEMHDPVIAWTGRYAPIYYGHGRGPVSRQRPGAAAGFDSVWAFELMWNPLEDLLSGKAVALYYYNLAYGLPLYIHIDLRTDNENALVFWWNASTCRHLGIGGTHANATVVETHKRAMQTYQRLKSYFVRGVFYGIDEQTHVHSSRDGQSAIVNCFNLGDQPIERQVRFAPAQFGLSSHKRYRFCGAQFRKAGDAWLGKVSIPARGHVLIEVK